MSEKPLFDKSMDELRESFVRARFAEEKVFGRADVEEWLAEQRQAITPEHSDTKHAWNSYLYKHLYDVANGREEEFLRQYASPNRTVPNDLGQIGGPRCEKEFLLMRNMAELFLRQGDELDFYWAYNYGPIAACPLPGSPIYVFAVHHPHNIVRPLTSGDTMEAIMASWYRYGNRKAGKFICDSMATKIAATRAGAETDFNSAVAVSADGTKIVCADEVIVWVKSPSSQDNISRFFSFSREVFASDKISLTEHRTYINKEPAFEPASLGPRHVFRMTNHTPPPRRDRDLFKLVYAEQLNRNPTPPPRRDPDLCQLVYKEKLNGKIYFVTHERFCPSPLPDGGVEMK